MVRFFDFLKNLGIVVGLCAFVVSKIIFEMAPSAPDAVNIERISINLSKFNKTITVYMSPDTHRLYDALETTYVLMFVVVAVLALTAGLLERKRKRTAI